MLCISDWKMATSFITLILTLFHHSLPPCSCKLLHSSIIVTLFSPSPGVFHSVGDVGGSRDSWGHNVTSSVAECSQSPGCHQITCWGNLQSHRWWQHPSCHCCCFPVTCNGTAPLRDLFPLDFSILPPAPWWPGLCSANVVIHPFPTLAISYFHCTCHWGLCARMF